MNVYKNQSQKFQKPVYVTINLDTQGCQVLFLLMVDCRPQVPIPGSKSSWNLHLLPVLVEDMAAGDLWPSGCWDIWD